MKIPKKVQIAGHEYDVVLDKKSAHTTGAMGVSNAQRLKIVIDSDFPASKQGETFLHEILHVVFAHASMTNIKELREHEEYIVDALACGLHQVLKDNQLRF